MSEVRNLSPKIQHDQLVEEIKELVAKVIKIPKEKITLEANLFTDLGVDSLLGVEIFAALDKKYGISVPEDKLRNITTLKDMVALVS
ncbi:MAG: acyl carrier protein, partial [Candidatus Margulisiibacteriota bacterium]